MLLVDSNPFAPTITCYEVNDQHTEVDLATAFDELVALTAERNFDMYEAGGNGTMSLHPDGTSYDGAARRVTAVTRALYTAS